MPPIVTDRVAWFVGDDLLTDRVGFNVPLNTL